MFHAGDMQNESTYNKYNSSIWWQKRHRDSRLPSESHQLWKKLS